MINYRVEDLNALLVALKAEALKSIRTARTAITVALLGSSILMVIALNFGRRPRRIPRFFPECGIPRTDALH